MYESSDKTAGAETCIRRTAWWPVMQHSRASRRHCLCEALSSRQGPAEQHFAAAAWRQDIIQLVEAPWARPVLC